MFSASGGPASGRQSTLPRTSYRLGFVGRERFHYWKLMVWTQLRYPQLLSYALTLAIYGYHFR
ncbi:MAG: DUF4070 domain-containing protein, partial [Lentisphaerales bacterium]